MDKPDQPPPKPSHVPPGGGGNFEVAEDMEWDSTDKMSAEEDEIVVSKGQSPHHALSQSTSQKQEIHRRGQEGQVQILQPEEEQANPAVGKTTRESPCRMGWFADS